MIRPPWIESGISAPRKGFSRSMKQDLGKLLQIYPISPIFLQRAAIVAVVSFIFFLVMLIAFSIRQNIGYFLLATAFLVVEIFTLIGWYLQRGAEFKIFEKGFSYKKQHELWSNIGSISPSSKNKFEVIKKDGSKFFLTEIIDGVDEVARHVGSEVGKVELLQ